MKKLKSRNALIRFKTFSFLNFVRTTANHIVKSQCWPNSRLINHFCTWFFHNKSILICFIECCFIIISYELVFKYSENACFSAKLSKISIRSLQYSFFLTIFEQFSLHAKECIAFYLSQRINLLTFRLFLFAWGCF